MSTFSLFSLLDNRSRPTPQRTSRGNHYASIIDAWLVTWNNEYLAWASIPIADWKADSLDILLFLSDQPVLIDLRSHWGTSTTPYAAAASDWQEPAVSVTGNLTGNAIFTPNAATTELGQHATGISTTNALAVSGYLLKTQPITRAIQNGETALDPQIHIRTIGESGVCSGFTPFFLTDPDPLGRGRHTPVILREQDYTLTMSENGDLFEYTWGGVKYSSPIVGLWAIR